MKLTVNIRPGIITKIKEKFKELGYKPLADSDLQEWLEIETEQIMEARLDHEGTETFIEMILDSEDVEKLGEEK